MTSTVTPGAAESLPAVTPPAATAPGHPLLEQAADAATAYLDSIPHRAVNAKATDAELHELLGGPLPENPADPSLVLDELVRGVERGLIPSGSGRYFGYVTGGALPVTMAADWLTSAWDQCTMVHDISPAGAVAEQICREWLVDLLGLPEGTSAAIVSGCSQADLVCLTVARHAVLANHGWDVATQGLRNAPDLAVLVNDSAHAAVIRSLQVLGLGGAIVPVESDGQGRIVASELHNALRRVAGRPIIAVGQVGDVNTGGVDDLRQLCDTVHEAGGWVHLDAAFGLWAAASPRLRPLVDGIELANSWATDAHKVLNVPYDCGIALVRDERAHRDAHPVSAAYFHLDPEQRHAVQWSIESSRRTRAFTLWTALRALGRRGVADLVEQLHQRARQLAGVLGASPGVHVVNRVVLNQVLIRLDHPIDPDGHTERVAAAFQSSGVGWAATSRWKGQTVIRMSISNWSTSEQDIEQVAQALLDCHALATSDTAR